MITLRPLYTTARKKAPPSSRSSLPLPSQAPSTANPSHSTSTHTACIITASEVLVGMGFGHGMGGGTSVVPEPVEEDSDSGSRGGGGGGGGGYSSARPVAVITIGPDGVHVEPIVDPTKMAIALFTTIASIFMVWAKIYKISHS